MAKKIFVTGATGYIGQQLVKTLAEEGNQVVALVRSKQKGVALDHPNITLHKGDITDPVSLREGMLGCDECFHVAAFAGVSVQKEIYWKINVEGTIHVCEAAQHAGLRRIVVTSSAGVLGPSNGEPVDELVDHGGRFFTDYEESKYVAEQKALECNRGDLSVVVVSPTRVYGPGPLNVSNPATKMIKGYAEGTWRVLPGDGHGVGNYVFIEDVVKGHQLAMQKGVAGEKYLLGGENVSYRIFFDRLSEIIGRSHKLYTLPTWLMMAVGKQQELWAKASGRKPLILPGFVRKYNHNWWVSSEKAKQELGYSITPLQEGMKKTLAWLRQEHSR